MSGHDFKFPGELGCAISHYSCIKQAKDLGYKSILIFEDDVTFLNNFNNIIESYLNVVPDDWDVLYLYSGLYRWTNDHYWVDNSQNKLFTSCGVNGCIAYGLRDKFFDVYLDNQNKSFQITDNFCNRLQHQFKYHFYSVVPNLCAQEINHSTINPDPHAIINVFPHMRTFQGKGPQDYF
jgi:GR25 family glycosyltransferase involved in LPS biosynthesis